MRPIGVGILFLQTLPHFPLLLLLFLFVSFAKEFSAVLIFSLKTALSTYLHKESYIDSVHSFSSRNPPVISSDSFMKSLNCSLSGFFLISLSPEFNLDIQMTLSLPK